jgi:hypothetical protein
MASDDRTRKYSSRSLRERGRRPPVDRVGRGRRPHRESPDHSAETGGNQLIADMNGPHHAHLVPDGRLSPGAASVSASSPRPRAGTTHTPRPTWPTTCRRFTRPDREHGLFTIRFTATSTSQRLTEDLRGPDVHAERVAEQEQPESPGHRPPSAVCRTPGCTSTNPTRPTRTAVPRT